MAGQDRETAQAEIAAIFARLKEEVRRGTQVSDGSAERRAVRNSPARVQAERAWAVTAERPFQQSPTRPGRVQAYVFVPVKRALRKLMRWYVEPVAADQRSFNLAVLALVDELAERVDSEIGRLEQRLEALEHGREADRPGRE
jgi:hypothetical protein